MRAVSGADDLLNAPAAGFVLVGGASRRMGHDKVAAQVGGVPLVARVHASLSEVVADIILVGKAGQGNPLPGVPFATDDHPERCALSGVVRALELAGDRCALVTACDHPFLAPALLRRLAEGPREAAVLIPEVGGRLQPLVAVYRSAEALPVLAGRLASGRLGLRAAIGELTLETIGEAEVRSFDPTLASFTNVNTESDLARAREAEKN